MPFELTGIHHVTLLVRDMARATEFYDGVLGLKRKERPPFSTPGAWYDLGGTQELHLLEIPAQVPDKNEAHPAFEVTDIRAAIAACRDAGVTVRGDIFTRPHDNSLSAFIADPDGNLIELAQHG